MRPPHAILGFLRLSRKLTREKLEALLSDRDDCQSCRYKLKRYRWIDQGGPWLWCPHCGWAGDAIDYGAAKFREPRDRVVSMMQLEPDPRADACHREFLRWRRIVRAVLNDSAGLTRETLNTNLGYLGIKVPRIDWSHPLAAEIGCTTSNWMIAEYTKWYMRAKLDRYLVVPVEAYPGLYTGLAIVESDAPSDERFGRLRVIHHVGRSQPVKGWIGLSAAARSDGKLGIPAFSKSVDWTAWTFRDFNYPDHLPAVVSARRPTAGDWQRLATVITPVHVQSVEDAALVEAMGLTGGRHCLKLDRKWANYRIRKALQSARTKEEVAELLPVTEPSGRIKTAKWKDHEIREGPDGWYVGEDRISNFRVRLSRRYVRADGVRTQRWKGTVLVDDHRLPFASGRGEGAEVTADELSARIGEKLTCKHAALPVLKVAAEFGGFETVGPVRLGWGVLNGFVLSGVSIRPSGDVVESRLDTRIRLRAPDFPAVRKCLRNRTNMQLAAIVCTTVACGYFDIEPKCVAISCANLGFRRILERLGARIVPRVPSTERLNNLHGRVSKWVRSGWPTVFALYDRPDKRFKTLDRLLNDFKDGRGSLIVRDTFDRPIGPGWVRLEIRKLPQRTIAEGLDAVLSTFLVWLVQTRPEAKTYGDLLKVYRSWLKSLKLEVGKTLDAIHVS